MKIIKKTKTETLITGVEMSGDELLEIFKEHSTSIGLDIPVEEDYEDWTTDPVWDTWKIDGKVTITFSQEDADLPRYKAPTTTKKVVKKK